MHLKRIDFYDKAYHEFTHISGFSWKLLSLIPHFTNKPVLELRFEKGKVQTGIMKGSQCEKKWESGHMKRTVLV